MAELKPFKIKAEIIFMPNKARDGYDFKIAYLCDRKKPCNNHCGNPCLYTLDSNHAQRFDITDE